MLIISLENAIFVTICQFTESLCVLSDYLVGTLDASFLFYFLIFVYIIFVLFSVLEPEEIKLEIAERRERFRSLDYNRSHSLLIPQIGEKTWGEQRTFSKVGMVAGIVGFRHRIGTKRDRHCM